LYTTAIVVPTQQNILATHLWIPFADPISWYTPKKKQKSTNKWIKIGTNILV
jgi:hypothetical protein